MAGALSRDDVRSISRDENRADFDRLQGEINKLRETTDQALRSFVLANDATLKAFAEANASTAKAVERLSLIVAGDDELEIDGLAHDVKMLKAARQETLVEKAKLGGILIGAVAVGTVVVKVLLYLIDKALT